MMTTLGEGSEPRSRISVTADAAREPFLHIRMLGDRYVVEGQTSCSFGHRIARGHGPDDGVFAAWTWSGVTLRIENDRYGLYPLYYAAWNGQIAVSRGIMSLLHCGPPTDLDYEGLAVFLRLGFFLAEDTPFRAIRVPPPNAALEWRAGRLSLEGGLQFPVPQDLGRKPAQDGFIELFANAIRKRRPPSEDFSIPLSGGRDSRHILLSLCAQGMKPRSCITVRGFRRRHHDEDQAWARDAAAVGFPQGVLDQTSSPFTVEQRKNVATDFCSDEHAWLLALADHLLGKARWVYDGIGGDTLSNGLFAEPESIDLYEANRVEELAERLLGPEIWSRILTGSAYARLSRSVAVGRLIRELYRHVSAPSTITSFFFWNRTRREIGLAPCRILARTVEAYCPYLDHDVFDLLAGLPPRMFLDKAFHTEAISRAFPRYASIGYFDRRRAGDGRLDANVTRAYAFALLRDWVLEPRCRLLRRRYWVPRVLRCLVDPTWGPLTISWLGPSVLYLSQLDSLMRSGKQEALGVRGV